MFELPETRNDLHDKLDALLDEDFVILAALITQLHHERFFRDLLPAGFEEAQRQKVIDKDFERGLDPSLTREEFEAEVFSPESIFRVFETVARSAIRGSPEHENYFFRRIRERLSGETTF